MMSDISGRNNVAQLPVFMSGLGVDQLLCVPKIAAGIGTGENMAHKFVMQVKIGE